VDRALTEQDYRIQVINSALRELVYWERKYKDYVEFSRIFQAIRETEKKLRKRK
jgi:hypothetical protein